MSRERILRSPEYWLTHIQMKLYGCAEKYMEMTGKNRTQLAQHLGVSKGYVSQLLNGNYDNKISKLVELSLACGYVPKIEFIPLDEFIKNEKNKTGDEI